MSACSEAARAGQPRRQAATMGRQRRRGDLIEPADHRPQRSREPRIARDLAPHAEQSRALVADGGGEHAVFDLLELLGGAVGDAADRLGDFGQQRFEQVGAALVFARPSRPCA